MKKSSKDLLQTQLCEDAHQKKEKMKEVMESLFHLIKNNEEIKKLSAVPEDWYEQTSTLTDMDENFESLVNLLKPDNMEAQWLWARGRHPTLKLSKTATPLLPNLTTF